MANYFPLIVNAVTGQIDELPAGSNLDMTNSGIVNLSNLTISSSDLYLTGGNAGDFLQTDGAGNLSWATANGGGNTTPGGLNGEMQYNANGTFGGIAGTSFDGATLTLGDITTVAIMGGANGQFLQTDGAGNLSFVDVNTGNANYANFAGTAFSVDGANVAGNVASAVYASAAGTADVAGIANSVDGINVVGEVATANYAAYAGTIVTGNQPNITSVGNLLSVEVTGNAVVGSILTNNYLYANGQPVDFNSNGSSNITQVNAGTGLSGGGSSGAVILNIANTGVANGSYGTASSVASFTVNDQGQLLSATDTPISIAGTAVTSEVANAAYATTAGTVTPAGATSQIQLNNSGALGASSNLTFSDTVGGGVLQVGTNAVLTGNGTLSSTIDNLYVQSAANVVVTAGSYDMVYDLTGNLTVPGNVTATYFFGNISQAIGLGNITSVNLDGNVGNVLAGDGTWIAASTGSQLLDVVTVSSTPYAVTSTTEQFLYVTNATATTVDLPETVVVGTQFIIKDALGANRVGNAITVSVANGTIDGNSTYTINAAWNSVTFVGVAANTYAAI